MPLPVELRWLDPLLDVLVDEFFERNQLRDPQPAIIPAARGDLP